MNYFRFRKFISDMDAASLDDAEKSSLRLDFMQKTGMPLELPAPSAAYYRQMAFQYARVAAYSVLLFVVGISPLALAAEYATPGDALYTFKEAINEPIKKSVQRITVQKSPDQIYEPQTEEVSNDGSQETKKSDLNNPKSVTVPLKKTPALVPPIQKTVNDAAIPILENTTKKLTDDTEDTVSNVKKETDKIIDTTKDTVDDVVDDVSKTVNDTVKDATKTIESTVDSVSNILDLSL